MKDHRTILHIGMHKTASTFLQTKIFPRFKRYTFLTRPFTQHNSLFNKLQYADETIYDAETTARELRAIDNELLISDESFSGTSFNCSFVNRTIIARRFHEIFPDATVILFIRGQQDALISNYNNYVENMRGTIDVHNFLWYPKRDYTLSDYNNGYYSSYPAETLYINNNRDNFHLDELKYYNLIKLYKRYFKNVHVFLFEDFRNDQRGVLTRIADVVGDELPDLQKIAIDKPVLGSLKPRNHLVRRIENFWLGFHLSASIPRYRWWLAKGMGLLCKPFLNPSQVAKEKAFIRERTNRHYIADNDLIIQHYPEIGIQNYPEKYISSAGVGSRV